MGNDAQRLLPRPQRPGHVASHLSHPSCYFGTNSPHGESIMKLISSLIICFALSACATDYASQLSESNFGYRVLYSRDPADPAQLMNGLYSAGPAGTVFCLNRCSREAPLSSSGFAP
jgi:hypothetical protein